MRRACAFALAQAAKDDPATFKLLYAGLKDQLLLSRRDAAEALGMLGGAASGAKSELEALAESEDFELAEAARAALKKIG